MNYFLYMDRKLLKGVFHTLCVLATVSLSIQCQYSYFLNETTSIVEYQKFQKDGLSGYPSISMCFMHPFLEPELRILGTNTSSYIFRKREKETPLGIEPRLPGSQLSFIATR